MDDSLLPLWILIILSLLDGQLLESRETPDHASPHPRVVLPMGLYVIDDVRGVVDRGDVVDQLLLDPLGEVEQVTVAPADHHLSQQFGHQLSVAPVQTVLQHEAQGVLSAVYEGGLEHDLGRLVLDCLVHLQDAPVWQLVTLVLCGQGTAGEDVTVVVETGVTQHLLYILDYFGPFAVCLAQTHGVEVLQFVQLLGETVGDVLAG